MSPVLDTTQRLCVCGGSSGPGVGEESSPSQPTTPQPVRPAQTTEHGERNKGRTVGVYSLYKGAMTLAMLSHTYRAENRWTPAFLLLIHPKPSINTLNISFQTGNIFTSQEYASRLATLRKYMSENGIGAVVLTSYHNINYYSGFIFCHFGRFYAVVVTRYECVTVSAGIDGGQPWRRSDNDGSVTYTDWHRDNYFHGVQQQLKDVDGRIGFEFDHVSLNNYTKFNDALPYHEKVDIGKATMRMRMNKSVEEVAVIRHGASIADLGGEAVVEAVEDGAPEHEVALHSTRVMVREIANTYPQSDIMDSQYII